MELIPINESKLKIMLDEIDMKEYRLGAECDCADTNTRRAIRDILDLARDKIGFNTEGAEIFVQLYTSKKGGCELFVTKGEGHSPLRDDTYLATDKISAHLAPKDDKRTPAQKQKKKDAEKTTTAVAPRPSGALHKHGDMLKGLAYSFEKMDGLCRVCKILFDRGVTTESRAMYDDSGAFYLLMYDTGLSAYSRLDAFSFITEFAAREGFSNLVTYLSEHGHTICDNNAIATLGSL